MPTSDSEVLESPPGEGEVEYVRCRRMRKNILVTRESTEMRHQHGQELGVFGMAVIIRVSGATFKNEGRIYLIGSLTLLTSFSPSPLPS